MIDRFLMAASLAILVFHPSSTIICCKSKSRPISPKKKKPSESYSKNKTSKSKKKQYFDSNYSKNSKAFNHVTELVEGKPSRSIVEAIFRSGWVHKKGCTVEKILKVNHNEDALNMFEEYREIVKLKFKADESGFRKRNERVLVDGNEKLRFYGTTLTCPLGENGVSSICDNESCGVCRVIGLKVLSKTLSEKSWNAHKKACADLESFNGMFARKAIILCRVIAGCVARYHRHGIVVGEDGKFDSVVYCSPGSEEIAVFDPNAVLPCFVVIYQTSL